ncbi:MAG: murein hydrolase activator EnvC family protein [Bacteroidales bacterium]
MTIRLFILSLFALLCMQGWGQSQKQLKELERKRKAALEQMEITDNLLQSNKKDAASTLNKIQLLGKQIEVRRSYIDALNGEVDVLEKQIRNVDRDVKDLQFELSMKKQNYAKAMQGMNKRKSSYDKLMFIFSADNLAQIYRRIRYLREYSVWRRIQSEEIMEKTKTLEQKRLELQNARKEKAKLLGEREVERKNLESEEHKQKEASKELNKKRKELQTQLKKQKQQAEALNNRIQQIIEEEARRAAEEARRAAEAKRKAAEAARRKAAAGSSSSSSAEKPSASTSQERVSESKGGYAMTKQEQQLSTNFGANRGKLPMPLRGRYVIIGRFGIQQSKDHKYVQTENKGIDILTNPGTEARSVFNGVVSMVFVVPGFNNTVMVRHGNYLTVYSNLSSVYVKKGDNVTTGQALGEVYSDKDENNRTVLHFQLWKETTKLNPELWLNK